MSKGRLAIEVRPVGTRSDFRAFLDFPWREREGDSHWVPSLRSEVWKVPNRAVRHLNGRLLPMRSGCEGLGVRVFKTHRVCENPRSPSP
jgi:hypothetical protein